MRVMEQVDTETERVVAVLHDVVGDSPYELDDIEPMLGSDVRDAVDAFMKRNGWTRPAFTMRSNAWPG